MATQVTPAEFRKLKRYLSDLCQEVEEYLQAMDCLMKEPSSVERGRKISHLINSLEIAKDRAKHFGLGKPLGKKKKGV